MTTREMTAEDIAKALEIVRRRCGPVVADVVAALRARAEAAEADNAAKDDVLRGVEHVFDRDDGRDYCPECGTEKPGHDEACALGHALHGAFRPGTGYRAKVRGELLRELAKEQRQAGQHTTAEYYEARAAREAHSDTAHSCPGCVKCCVNEQQVCPDDAQG